MMKVDHNCFSFRDGELVKIKELGPDARYAVMLRSVDMPPGPRHEVRSSDGAAVENLAVLCCQRVRGKWQWQQFDPASKEAVGDVMIDLARCKRDVWYEMAIGLPGLSDVVE